MGGLLPGTSAGRAEAGWAEASRRHVRHASRRAEGLGLRLVSGWHTLRLTGQSQTAPKGPGQPQALFE